MTPSQPSLVSDAAIEVEGVGRTFSGGSADVEVLRNVSFSVDTGEWVAIMGPSGSGKTTLLHALGGLDRVDAGSISVGGRPLSATSESERAKRRRGEIAYVFQQYNLLSDLTALENVMLPLRMNGASRRAARRQAVAILSRLGLGARRRAHPSQLSGGEQQRVALARALVVEPTVLLADEPTGALDTVAGNLVLEVLREQHEAGQTIVMVTHDHRVASSADRILTMRDGEVTEEHRLRAVHSSDLGNLLSLDLD